MTSTPKNNNSDNSTSNLVITQSNSPSYGTLLPSGHKGSLKSNKLARRARSFKDDFLEKISQIRTPTGTLTRPLSPNSPKGKPNKNQVSHQDETVKPIQDVNYHVKQVKHALTHFKDVISKNKLEMLHGNGTIVLESVTNVLTALKTYNINEKSSMLISATQQCLNSLGNLIKLCDDVLLSENEENCAALNKENVKETVDLVETAIQKLIEITNERLNESGSNEEVPCNLIQRHSVDSIVQRTSLPDIPLTPKDRKILEQSIALKPMRVSHSTDSLLRDTSPPPKPPLPNRYTDPPPLPPKKKPYRVTNSLKDVYTLPTAIDTSSSLSRSPEDNSDIISIGSSDSLLLRSSLKNESSQSDVKIDWSLEEQSKESEIWKIENLHQRELTVLSTFKSSTHQTKEASFEINRSSYSTMDEFDMSSDASLKDGDMKGELSENIINGDIFTSNHSMNAFDDNKPPLPAKTKPKYRNSQYDNFDPDFVRSFDNLTITQTAIMKSKCQSFIETRDREQPPPLPMKKKHIMAYMEIFGNCSSMRHSIHTCPQIADNRKTIGVMQQISSTTLEATPPGSPRLSSFQKPPALPPKKTQSKSFSISTPPASPRLRSENEATTIKHQTTTTIVKKEFTSTSSSFECAPQYEQFEEKLEKLALNDRNNNDSSRTSKTSQESLSSAENTFFSPQINKKEEKSPIHKKVIPPPIIKEEEVEVVLREKNVIPQEESSLIEETDVLKYLIFKKEGEDGPDVKGGQIDALIIHATKTKKSSDAFGEAFLTTFRTFISPLELIDKLTYRYTFLRCQINDQKQRAAKETFSLLIRVVSDLTAPDITVVLLHKVMEFINQLICAGELYLAKSLRLKFIDKANIYKIKSYMSLSIPSRTLITNPPSLLDLRSTEIAQQMTLLDAELFRKIEIPEVLIWAQEQCEERSPNLTLFTEHFNKMSYWARTQILKQQDAKDREKHVLKFIKIMKHLRKINNYNSYLALLSALDSAPVRRLEWHKQITEGLKEYCALIDSSSSFRAYRQALGETCPPCIPYIGLVLQDLTFVHIGNPDYLPDGSLINFSKRWQQYNIVVNMKRFREGSFNFKKNERIINFFDNFDNYFDEDAMWQISEQIKPRGTKKNC